MRRSDLARHAVSAAGVLVRSAGLVLAGIDAQEGGALSGYTPLFSSLATGTLCGKWPDIGLWPIVLSLADKNGVVDVTPAYLAQVTGLALPEIEACMRRFCEPDPYSRSREQGGARLELLELEREWGWRVVNHAKYKERARLQSKSQREIETGKNAERMGDRRRPPETAADPLSDADADADKRERPRKRGTRLPEDFVPDPETALSALPDLDVHSEALRFRDYWSAKTGHGATKTDWQATWRNWIRNCKDSGRYAKAEKSRKFVC